MSRLDHHIAGVRNKMAVQRGVAGFAWAAMVICALVLIGIMTARFLGWHIPAVKIVLCCCAGVVGLCAIVWGIMRRPSAQDAAVYIDQKLNLEERFSTALHVRKLNDPFAAAALRDAETMADKVAGGVPVAVRFPTAGYIAVGLALLAVAAFTWMPRLDLFGHRAAAAKQAERKVAAAQAISSAQAALVEMSTLPKTQTETPEFKQLQHDLKEIVEQKQVSDPASVKREALQAMQDVNKKLDEAAAIERMQTVADNRFFSQIAPSSGDETPIAKVERDISHGQVDKAVNELNHVVQNFNQMDKPQQEQVEKQVQDLAQKLQQAASNPQTQQQIQKQLQQLGANQQQANQLAKQMQQAAQGNTQAQQQLQQTAQQMMNQMNNGQGPTQQQQQQIQQVMSQMQATANSQQQAASMAKAAQQLASAMRQAQQAQAQQPKPQQGQSAQSGQKQGSQSGSQAQNSPKQGTSGGQQAQAAQTGQGPQAQASNQGQSGQKPPSGQQGQGQSANKGGQGQSQTANQGQKQGSQNQGQGQTAQQGGKGGAQQGQTAQSGQGGAQSAQAGNQSGGQQGSQGAGQQMASAQAAMQQAMSNMQAAQQNATQITAAQAQANAAQQQALNGMNAPGGNNGQGGQQAGAGHGGWGVQPPQGQGNQGAQPPGGQGQQGLGAGGNTGVAAAPYDVKKEVDLSKEDPNGQMLASSLIKDNHPDPGKAKLMLSAVTASQSPAAADEVDSEHTSGTRAREAAEEYFRTMEKDAQQQPPPK